MRIAVIHSFYDERSPSGENTIVEEQISLLRAAGHDVELIARHTSEMKSGIAYLLQAGVTTATGFGPEPTQQLDAFRPDIVHCHNLFPNWGSRWLNKYQHRTVATFHNYRPLCSAATLYRDGQACELCPSKSSLHAVKNTCYRSSITATIPLALASRGAGRHAKLLQQSALRIVLNEQAAAAFKKYYPHLDFSVVPNAIQPRSLRASPRAGWLFAGRLTEDKGIKFLERHWPRREHLTIAGDGPLSETVQRLAEAEPDTFTHLGSISRDTLRDLLPQMEGLVLPSLWGEGLPTVLIEALAANTPALISQRCDALREMPVSVGVAPFEPAAGDAGLMDALNKIRRAGPAAQVSARETFDALFAPEIWLQSMTKHYETVSEAA